MLIARAPVRISLAGGGTDLPAYYARYGGAVISATIDKRFYVFLSVSDDDALQISSSDYHTFYRHSGKGPLLWDGDLRLPRAILSHFGIRRGVTLFLASEIPPGTGLGSSSAVTVGIIKAVSTALGLRLDRHELADLACHIELDKLRAPIGKQDQYASAFGGLNWIEFKSGGVHIEPLVMPSEALRQLEGNLLLFFTGSSRGASTILRRQSESSQRRETIVIEALHRVKAIAYEAREALERGDITVLGGLLHENWENKKRFAQGISNPRIDELYEAAREAGALGGKITGAGGGGFLMLYCELERQADVTAALEGKGLKRMDFRFENMGAQVVMNAGLTLDLTGRRTASGRAAEAATNGRP